MFGQTSTESPARWLCGIRCHDSDTKNLPLRNLIHFGGCSHLPQVTEEMRFGTDEAPKARDAVILQVHICSSSEGERSIESRLFKGKPLSAVNGARHRDILLA